MVFTMTDQIREGIENTSKLDKKITRRKAVKTIAGGITALAAYHTLPAKWEKPILESIFIPAHAQTSAVEPQPPEPPPIDGGPDEPINPVEPPGPVEPPSSFDGRYSGTVTMTDDTGDTSVTTQASVVAVYTAPNAAVTVTLGGDTFCRYVGSGPANQVISLNNIGSSGGINCPGSGQFSVISAADSTVDVGISIATFTGQGTLIKTG